jgi:hypothetical protein
MARARLRPPDGEACWPWLLERLDRGHPDFLKACWWSFQLVCTRPAPTDPATNQAVVDRLFAVALDPASEARVKVQLARTLMEMQLGELRAQAQARRLRRRLEGRAAG